MFFHQGLGSISLQEAPGVAIVVWQSKSYLYSWSLTLLFISQESSNAILMALILFV
jgi:hypothetical protein